MRSGKKLKDPARKIDKSAEVFLPYIKRRNKEPVHFEAAEFKDATPMDLALKMVAMGDSVTIGLAAVLVMERQDTIDFRLLSTLPALQQDLLSLQWMARQLK